MHDQLSAGKVSNHFHPTAFGLELIGCGQSSPSVASLRFVGADFFFNKNYKLQEMNLCCKLAMISIFNCVALSMVPSDAPTNVATSLIQCLECWQTCSYTAE